MGVYGAIVGKAVYTGALDLREALAAAKEEHMLAKRIIPALTSRTAGW